MTGTPAAMGLADSRRGSPASVPVVSEEAAAGTSEQTPVVQGLHVPDVEEPDVRGAGT